MNILLRVAFVISSVILVGTLGLTLQDSFASTNQSQTQSKVADPIYRIKVTFDSITIHDDSEGPFSGDGEFDLSAYVQGNRVALSGSTTQECLHAGSEFPPCDLWDVSAGETLIFKSGTEATVDLPQTVPLSIFTVGGEIDGCGRIDWPGDGDFFAKALLAQLNDPKLVGSGAVTNFAYEITNAEANFYCGTLANWNDQIGQIRMFYDAPSYGAGSHEEKSKEDIYGIYEDIAHYTLRYTISVTPPPKRIIGEIPPTQVLEELACKTNLPVSSVTSSGDQPSFPRSNAIDNNLNTKWWSTIIVDPFITLDLGTSKSVCGVDIVWADGALHPYRFDVSVSPDNTSFTSVFSGTSTGTTSSPEKYSIPLSQARYVKIIVTESTPGSPRSIAEISEIDVFS